MTRALAVAVALLWLLLGVWGTSSYVQHQSVSRTVAPPPRRDPVHVRPGRLVKVRFYSRSLGEHRSYLVYLPAGYEEATREGQRFPVLYLLHGQPGTPTSITNAGAAGVTLDRLVAADKTKPFLLVVPDGQRPGILGDTEWADTPSASFESYVLDVVRSVDARWATLPDRMHRGIAGLSEGGYAAINISLRHLDAFSVAESWSGYFIQDRSSPAFRFASPWLLAVNSPLEYVSSLAPQLRRSPYHAFLYAGRVDRDLPQLRVFSNQLRNAGGDVAVGLYSGGHSFRLWRHEMPRSLLYAGRWFDTR